MSEAGEVDPLDPSLDDAIGVWDDLERALAGKNGFGGDVAEIYAYRLVPGGVKAFPGPASKSPELAILAGRNLTRLLKHFTALHHANVAIEEQHCFRTLDLGCEEVPPFDWRVHLCVQRIPEKMRPAPPVHEVRKVIADTTAHLGIIASMLDELAAHRAKQRLGLDLPPVDTDDLPPDGPTGLYLDVPFGEEDPEWIKRAFDAFTSTVNYTGRSKRPSQLLLVFQAIRCDDRATTEFLRAMNTIVLPFLRRLRLRDQPQLASLGAASE